jgi:hypothetical protein
MPKIRYCEVVFCFPLGWFLPLSLSLLAAGDSMLISSAVHGAEHVIHISVDGLNAKTLESVIDSGDAPTFKRLRDEGATTFNARTDFTHTVTLPNHTSMITGRPVFPPAGMGPQVGHHWIENDVPQRDTTLHKNHPAAEYVASTFDVAHDAGLATAMYASKDKFVIYDQSYNETAGREHVNGRDKIDVYYFQDDGEPQYSASLNARLLADMAARHFNYVFVHYRDTDSVGHSLGWGSKAYRQTIKTVDGYLAELLQLIDADPALAGKTAIVLTTDHGGLWYDHSAETLPPNYTIPLMVWGAGVGRGDLYKMNAESRADPGDSRPDYNASGQPIRNGDTGNLAIALLGLPPIPGSLINAKQDLRIAMAGDYNLDGTVGAADFVIWKKTEGSTHDFRADGNGDGRVDQADHDVWKAHFGESAILASGSGS